MIPNGFAPFLPDRWRARAYAALRAAAPGVDQAASEDYKKLFALIEEIGQAPIAIDATYAQLCVMAQEQAEDCQNIALSLGDHGAPVARAALEVIVRQAGIAVPGGADQGAINRMTDPVWWRRALRTMHGRTFEHAALRLGLVSMRTGSYCSNETATRRRHQIERNKAAMQAAILSNGEQDFSMYELAMRGMANKANRKGELMLRMAACEEIAEELGHVGLFVTVTCPSKYHAVIAKTGAFNPKYQGATPRQAQDYLNLTWTRTRAQNHRDGVMPYGFRIAEPHHDGCPHWHMLVFMPPGQVQTFIANLGQYAMAEDAHELNSDSARDARLKIIAIDPAKGSAAGYIAKYVGKNIDDSQGAAHDEDGAAMLDPHGEPIQRACERVDAWAAVWGIRQFQGLGMPPVTVWRELRRVANLGADAPAYVRQAVNAGKRVTCALSAKFCKEPAIIKAADFAEYIRAQGGINLGRDYRIAIAHEPQEPGVQSMGRYGAIEDEKKPIGIYARVAPDAVYQSTRYTWTRKGGTGTMRAAVALDVAGPWSPLNNCTGPVCPLWSADDLDPVFPADEFADWWESADFEKIFLPPGDVAAQMIEQEAWARDSRANTVWTRLASDEKRGVL